MKKLISFILCLTILCSVMIYTVNAETLPNNITAENANTFSVTEMNFETGEETVRTFDKVASPQLSEMKQLELPVSTTMSSRAIIGEDERTKVKKTTVYPYSAIVFLEIDWGDEKKAATGFMISDNVAVTSAHAIYKKTYDGFPESIKVSPAKNGLINPYGSSYIKAAGVSTQFAEFIDNSTPINGQEELFMQEDWGAIVLNEPLGRETGTIGLKCPTDSELYALKTSETIKICGYSKSYDLINIYHQYEISGNILYYSIDTISHVLDVKSGQSGSPVLNADNVAIGIVFGSDEQGTFNFAVRMDENMMYYFNLAIDEYTDS